MATVPADISEVSYTGNGVSDSFNTGIPILETSNLVVDLLPSGDTVPTPQVEGVDYNVGAAPSASATVSMVVAPPVASTLRVRRTLPIVQEVDLLTQGPFSPATLTEMLDRRTMVEQQLSRRLTALESAGAVGSVVAGAGLSFDTTILNVGAGAGIQANADTVEVLFAVAGPSPAFVGGGIGGVADRAAREDHGHSVTTSAPADLAIGNVAATGAGGDIARASHVHGVPAGIPVNVTKAANAEGAATTFARSDHKHDVTTAAAIALTDSTNAEGAATTLARSDHTHSHGARGGGTLHAEATTAVAGFQSAADKTSADAIGAVAIKSHVHAYQAAAQSIPNGIAGTTVIFEVEDYDADGEYNPATGIFTAKAAGYLLVNANAALASAAWLAGAGAVALFLIRNKAGDITEAQVYDVVDANVSKPVTLHISKVVKVAIGDTVRVALGHSQGDSVNTQGVRASCSITVDRII